MKMGPVAGVPTTVKACIPYPSLTTVASASMGGATAHAHVLLVGGADVVPVRRSRASPLTLGMLLAVYTRIVGDTIPIVGMGSAETVMACAKRTAERVPLDTETVNSYSLALGVRALAGTVTIDVVPRVSAAPLPLLRHVGSAASSTLHDHVNVSPWSTRREARSGSKEGEASRVSSESVEMRLREPPAMRATRGEDTMTMSTSRDVTCEGEPCTSHVSRSE
mmetsp:Transcript_27236/g.67178  ORF Transcript_27236/g.67178 Transcript_27236/m.67178 type:complete len:222 (-) Transcript_27236:6368-7033(-)